MSDESTPKLNEEEIIETSPLWEADQNALDKIFDAIDKKLALNLPREITDPEVERMVDYYLRGRETFMKEIADGKTPSRKNNQNSAASKLSKEEKAREALKRLDF